MVKRTADWLEKISAGAMLIGIFQDTMPATIVGLVFFGFSEFLTWRGEK